MINTKKLFKMARERTISGALGIALLFSSINLTTKAENLVPSLTTFAEPSVFDSNTNYGLDADDKVQKVYFGKNGDAAQGWYIAGYDEVTGGLVFLCDPNQPIASNQVFCNTTSVRDYNKSWGCTYSNAPEKVNPNHYGGSDIRKKLQELEKDTNVFTEAEQCLIKETTIYTYDSKQNNYQTYYSTKDKLYLAAAGVYQDSYITVGANTVDSTGTASARVNNGLKVKLNSGPNGSPYTTGEAWFWLRSPYIDYNVAHGASIGDHVTIYNVDDNYNCVPAFALDTSSMLFASAAVPVSSNSTLSDGIYFRFKDTNSKIDTTIATSGNELTITKGNKNVYLYIQGKDITGDWVYSKLISNTETLTPKDIHEGLTSFSNCKAWLETSEDNITYAQELNLSDVSTIRLVKRVPSPTAFGEPSAFGSNTSYGLDADDKVQKVYFGKNGNAAQGWYIAGYDETKQNLVLFCDPNQPVLSNQIFLAQDKYDAEWCNITSYEDGETYTTPTKVYANHYGGSDIRKDLQKLEKDTKVFTAAEQDLMKESRVQTYDHLKGTLYTTTDKLYLATGDLNEENTLIKVGDSLSGEFNVELASGPDGSPYTTEGQSFWLRTPHYENHLDTLEAETGEKVTYKSFLDHGSNCAPAFALDTSSMLFASSAVPVSSNSTLSDGIYFRFKDTNSKIDTTLAANSGELTITKGNKNVYLYIQGKDSTGDWVYSKLISNTETLAAKDIHEGLTSFNNCKAWLETSEDNITYAQELNLSDVSTIKLLNVYSVSIKLKDEFGKVITNTKGITLKLDETPMEDNGDGVFTLDNLTNESYKLTIILDENVSDYLTPGVSTFTITNGSNGSIDVATLNVVVKLQQKEIEIKRVLTGAGGEAGYKYNRKTGKTKFHCSPYPGYKLDKILKDTDDKTEYVSFKIV